MIVEQIPSEFQQALPVLKTIQDNGFEAYFVGGSVRDTILGLPIHDVDIATSAYPAEVKALFKKTVDTGIEHGTVMVIDHGKGYEVTTFRTESGYQDYRRPDKVTFVRSLADDLKRRDLTINALAMDMNGKIVDLFGGLDDLKNHLIRAVGVPAERYHEDALRMMRTVRFASKLDFAIDPTTEKAIAENAPLLAKIAVERIHEEWVKLLQGRNIKRGVQALIDTGLYQYCPGLKDYRAELAQLLTLPAIKLTSEEAVWTLITTLCELDDSQVSRLLRQWKSSREIIHNTLKARVALRALRQQQLDALMLYQTGLPLLLVANQVAAFFKNQVDETTLRTQYEKLPIKSKRELVLTGNDLLKAKIITPGPRMGQILNTLEVEVVQGKVANQTAALMGRACELAKQSD
ncbi:CCA tRNA nucleotidyltransferase [Ligilactobacillus saerimneri]|uniref:CCA tRNA nucleotidyltransferase n=1 Tax=Ligilactobacillus saerimneri TaxID=228229 RepID=UPI001C0FE9F2|nr:CCA tRNA nucleotidyltransferase [Ligilactobacillus saerimneri]MBU5309070.1 CCA tRNA nucleotidyltransferase [Ligilactobacillus saerimneri]